MYGAALIHIICFTFYIQKVYTINDESQHLLIQNVPSIGLLEEVKRLAAKYGRMEKVELLKSYPAKEEFTHAYYVKYCLLKDARYAKKKLDNRSFFGSILHVCYAPELETVDECKRKLKERINGIQKKWNPHLRNKKSQQVSSSMPPKASSISLSTECGTGTWSNLLPSTSSFVIPKSAESK